MTSGISKDFIKMLLYVAPGLCHVCVMSPHWMGIYEFFLTPKQLGMHGCVLNTVATDALVLKHQAISIHSADKMSIVLDWFNSNYYIYSD